MPDFTDRAAHMRVLWERGENMFASFFAELEAIRTEFVDDSKFRRWCIDDLHIPLSTCFRISDLLRESDAIRVRSPATTCLHCGKPINPVNPARQYCSDICRVYAWRARRRR
jgi:hypothetical protein